MSKSPFYAAAAALALGVSGMLVQAPDYRGPIVIGGGRKKASTPPPPNPKAERRKMLKVRAMQERKAKKRGLA